MMISSTFITVSVFKVVFKFQPSSTHSFQIFFLYPLKISENLRFCFQVENWEKWVKLISSQCFPKISHFLCCCSPIETSQLICKTNQVTGFYMTWKIYKMYMFLCFWIWTSELIFYNKYSKRKSISDFLF